MNDINLITYPDKLFSDNLTLLIINPSNDLKNDLQKDFLASAECNINLYMFEYLDPDQSQIDWLLSVFHKSNITIIDVDRVGSKLKDLSSYFIAKPKTYWLTNADNLVYNHISNKRIYNLDFLSSIGGYFG